MGRYQFGVQQKCATCPSTKVAESDFADGISKKEFEISGMCQKCQDMTFGNKGGVMPAV